MRNLALMLALTPLNGLDPSPSEEEKDDTSMYQFKTMFIMRGLPGSGKSSIALSLIGCEANRVENEGHRFIFGKEGVICSTDSYFYDHWSSLGEYNFDPRKIGDNHQKNQNAVLHAMNLGVPCIVVDNTNVREWETEVYTKLAEEHGYKIVVVEVPHVSVDLCVERNAHGVPRETIERMDQDYNKFRLNGTDGEEV